MKTLRVIFALLIAGLTLCTTLTFGKIDYSKAEKKPCIYCHVNVTKTPKELNDVGKCYAKNQHSLKGCEEKPKSDK